MIKAIMTLAPALLLGACAANGAPAKIEVNVPEEAVGQTLIVNYTTLDSEEDYPKADTLKIEKTTTVLTAPTEEAYVYNFNIGAYFVPEVFVEKGETAKINVKSYNPFECEVTGTPLLEGMTEYSRLTDPLQHEYVLSREAGASTDVLDSIYDRFQVMTRDFINKDPKSPAAVYALISLNGQEFLAYYDKLKDNVAQSTFFKEYVNQKRAETVQQVEAEKMQNALVGKPAPGFTLKNLAGKDVSLAQFKGKWVVLDFWGSWCIWCIKGFPELKENYAKYAGKFEVIGVDCGDSEDQWRDAVKKYELPWVNVYNPKSNETLTQAYAIQGFPTKIIVDPAGNVADVTVGEDPSFYSRLSKLIK